MTARARIVIHTQPYDDPPLPARPAPSTETIRALVAARGHSLRKTAEIVGVNYRTLARMLHHQHGTGVTHPPQDDDLYWADLRTRVGDALGLEWGEP